MIFFFFFLGLNNYKDYFHYLSSLLHSYVIGSLLAQRTFWFPTKNVGNYMRSWLKRQTCVELDEDSIAILNRVTKQVRFIQCYRFFFFFFFLVAFLFLNGNLLDNNSFITVANQWKLKIVTVFKKGQIWYNNGKLCSQTLPQILKPNHFINSFICCLFEPIEKNTHTHPQRPREETTASLSLFLSLSLSKSVSL